LAIFSIVLFTYFKKDIFALGKPFLSFISNRSALNITCNTILIVGCFFFSFFFFSPHLTLQQGAIFTSPTYWDFHWHAALIQNFAYGDNFPPENEAFSGFPHTYHYFWGVTTAIYEVLGLNLVDAINFVSILTFSAFLFAIIGISEELFHTKISGILAVFLTLTSSSWHALDYLQSHNKQNLEQFIYGILTSTQHPFFSTIYQVKEFTYNGTFFNLFYFVEERQLIFGVLYLLIAIWILYKRKDFSNNVLICIGACLGAYFLWHLFVCLSILGALLFLMLFDQNKQKTLHLLFGFCIVFGIHYLYFKQLSHSSWFLPKINNFPQINFGFSDQRGMPFSLIHAWDWYFYSYGIKVFLLPISLVWLWFKNRRAALVISGIIIPTFIVLNTVQLSPADIYENHKWLRPMNVAIDITIAGFMGALFFSTLQKSLSTAPFWALLLFLLTASGIIEIMPYFNSKPTRFFAFYPSRLSKAIEINTKSKATFVSNDDKDVYLAGRKLFLGDTLGSNLLLDKGKRKQIIRAIYNSTNLNTFCNLTKQYKIDYVNVSDANLTSKTFQRSLPHFSSVNQQFEATYFTDVKAACGK
jgi:hypothetical protein